MGEPLQVNVGSTGAHEEIGHSNRRAARLLEMNEVSGYSLYHNAKSVIVVIEVRNGEVSLQLVMVDGVCKGHCL